MTCYSKLLTDETLGKVTLYPKPPPTIKSALELSKFNIFKFKNFSKVGETGKFFLIF